MALPEFADSEMPDDDAEQPATNAGQIAELCIGVMQDGTLTVYKETGEEAEEQESPRQTANSIGEALQMVLRMYREVSGGSEDAFQAGYAGDDTQPTPKMPRIGPAAGRSMA